mgnify:CR=1 FL=1
MGTSFHIFYVIGLNPIASRTAAVAWIVVWKVLDHWTTRTLLPLDSTSELNPLINTLSPVIGIDGSLFLTSIMAVGFTYGFYYHMPIVVEALAIYLPLAVIGNFMVFINPLLNQIIVVFSVTSLICYLIYYELTKRNHDYSMKQSRFFDTSSLPD